MRDILADVKAGQVLARVLGPDRKPATVADARGVRFGPAPDPMGQRGEVLRLHACKTDPDSDADRPGCRRAWAVDCGQATGAFTVKFGFYAMCFQGIAANDEVCVWGMRDKAGLYTGSISANVGMRGGVLTLWFYIDAQGRQELCAMPLGGFWTDITIEAFIHPENGFVRIRRNGMLAADYAGPVGGGETDGVMRFGVYHWPEYGNTWTGLPDRVAFFHNLRASY